MSSVSGLSSATRWAADQKHAVEVLPKLRVCFLAGTLGQGGAERQLYYMLRCLRDCGAEANVLTLTKGEHWEEALARLGVVLHYVGETKSRLRRLWNILRKVRQLRPQVLQGQHFYTGIYCGVAGRLAGIPSLGAVRSDGLRELKSNGRLLGNLSLRLPDWIAANSERAVENLKSAGFRSVKFLLIPNVVDTEWFKPVQEPRSADQFVILGIGSLEPVKRFDRLLEIAVVLSGRIKRRVRVIVAGNGSQRPPLEALAEQVRRKGVQVELVGRVDDPLRFYHAANVLLLASDCEGTPNVIMEAMACGVPVVATRIGGVADMVTTGETGFLFNPNNVEAAVDALALLVSNSDLAAQIGRRGRAFIEENCPLSLLKGILTGLYEAVLAKGCQAAPQLTTSSEPRDDNDGGSADSFARTSPPFGSGGHGCPRP